MYGYILNCREKDWNMIVFVALALVYTIFALVVQGIPMEEVRLHTYIGVVGDLCVYGMLTLYGIVRVRICIFTSTTAIVDCL